jgi:hypothetical protein
MSGTLALNFVSALSRYLQQQQQKKDLPNAITNSNMVRKIIYKLNSEDFYEVQPVDT